VNTFLGLIGLVIFIVCVVALAAAVTAAVVRISPTRDKKQTGESPS
jgi:hypothetical protein